MLTGLRRVLVTALLSVLVGLGVVAALVGRRPRQRIATDAQILTPTSRAPVTGRRSNRLLASGLASLLLLAALAGVIYAARDVVLSTKHSSPADDDARPLAALSPPEATLGAPAQESRPSAPDRPIAGSTEQAGGTLPGPSAPPAPAAPSFDIVRVEPSGDAVVAGRAVPNATVELLVDGRPVAKATANAAGQFTLTPPALPTGSSEMSLRVIDAQGGEGRSSTRVAVAVAPSRDARPLVAVMLPDRPTRILSQPDAPAVGIPAPNDQAGRLALGDRDGTAAVQASPGLDGQTATAPVGSGGPHANRPSTGSTAKTGQAGADASSGPTGSGPETSQAGASIETAGSPPKIVSIDAGTGGGLFITGRAAAGSSIRLYLNDTLIAPATVGRDGTVTFTIGQGVRSGAYTVRLDLVDPATGKVRQRAEVPFAVPSTGHDDGVEHAAMRADTDRLAGGAGVSDRRAAGETAARSGQPAGPTGSPQPSSTGSLAANLPPRSQAGSSEVYVPGIETVRIVRGDSLWRISRRNYSEGERYTLIYDANQDQIRDPDLIYPGQVLVLPSQGGTVNGRDGGPD